jgi:hypothetical protein
MSPNFIDYNGLNNERETSTARTLRAIDFRTRILTRDGSCVVTRDNADFCDAAHLIPRRKGDAVGSLLVYIVSILILLLVYRARCTIPPWSLPVARD